MPKKIKTAEDLIGATLEDFTAVRAGTGSVEVAQLGVDLLNASARHVMAVLAAQTQAGQPVRIPFVGVAPQKNKRA